MYIARLFFSILVFKFFYSYNSFHCAILQCNPIVCLYGYKLKAFLVRSTYKELMPIWIFIIDSKAMVSNTELYSSALLIRLNGEEISAVYKQSWC